MGNYWCWDHSYCVQSIVADVYESNLYQLMRMIFRLCWFLIRADATVKKYSAWNSLDRFWDAVPFWFWIIDGFRYTEMELHDINNASDSQPKNRVKRTRNIIIYPEILSIMQMNAKIAFCCAAKIGRTCREYMVGSFFCISIYSIGNFRPHTECQTICVHL